MSESPQFIPVVFDRMAAISSIAALRAIASYPVMAQNAPDILRAADAIEQGLRDAKEL